MNNQRIPNETLYGNYVDGQILQHTDVNKMIDVLKTGVNANYDDITKMKNGIDTVGKAASLNGLVATTFEDGVLDNDDEKLPTSKKVKQYVDNKVSEATPQKGVDYFTNAEVSQITNSIKSEINNSMGASIEAAVNVGKSELDDYIEDLETSATSNFNDNYDSKLSSINSASSSALDDISDAKEDALSDIDSELSDAINQFNTNASNKTSSFNTNATSKTNSYNDNASSKLSAYNTNDENKTNAFNQNYSDKLSSFNTNAGNKQDAFDENASNKTNSFNSVADRKISILEQLIATIPDDFSAFTLDIVETLPSTGVPMCIYLVPNGNTTNNQNIYDEYLWLEETSRFEEIGKLHTSTDIDLSQYATRSDIANMITTTSFATDNTAGIFRTGYGAALDGSHQLYAKERTYQEYQNMGGKQFIGKSTLENVLAGKRYDNDIASLKEDRDVLVDLTTGNTTISAEGKSITIDKRILSLKNFELLGDTYQSGVPTPANPKPIHTVTDWQMLKDDDGGKNLFNVNNVWLGYSFSYGDNTGNHATSQARTGRMTLPPQYAIKVKPNTKYTFSINNLDYDYAIGELDENLNTLGDYGWKNLSSQTITTKADTKYIVFNFALHPAASFTNISNEQFETFKTINMQLEEGQSATTYEPFVGKVHKINLGTIELCKIGNYQDKIYKQNGKWYLEKNVRKYNQALGVVITSNNRIRVKVKDTRNLHDVNISVNTYCPALINICENIDQVGQTQLRYNGGWGGLVILFSEDVSTVIGLDKTERQIVDWFNNNCEIYAAINPDYDYPEITEITDATLISQLESVQLNNNANNIYCVSNAQNGIIHIDATANIIDILENKADKSELDNKQDKLTAGTNITIAMDGTISATGGSTFSGSYNDLSDKPTLFSGSYNDLSNKPTIPDELKDLTEDSSHRLVTDTEKQAWNNKSSFSGNYNDLSNKPTLFSGSYNDLSNKPTIPTVPTIVDNLTTNDATKTLSAKQGKVLKDALDDKANADEVIQEQSPFYGAKTYLTAAEVIDLIHANKMNIIIYGDVTPLLDRSEGN